MSIQERVNPDNLSIHQFQEVPEGKPELPFDPEKDLSDNLKDKAVNELKTNDVRSYCQVLARARLLWPNEKFDDKRITDERMLNDIKASISYLEEGAGVSSELFNIMNIVMARPHLDISSVKEKIVGIAEQAVIKRREDQNYYDLLDIVSYTKRIDPAKVFNFTQEDLIHMKINAESSSDLVIAAFDMQKLRYIDPDYKPKLTDEQWEFLHKELSTQGLPLAFAMKVLSAYSVKVTAPGIIEFQMYPLEDVNTQTPPIPETRKF